MQRLCAFPTKRFKFIICRHFPQKLFGKHFSIVSNPGLVLEFSRVQELERQPSDVGEFIRIQAAIGDIIGSKY